MSIAGVLALLLATTVATVPAPPGIPVVESANWSGYLADARSGAYVAVRGTFVQPAVGQRCRPASDLLTWVGLGGFNARADNRVLIQVGTDADFDIAEGTRYGAWYQYLRTDLHGGQLLGSEKMPLPVRIRPGDTIALSTSVRAGTATFEVHNTTTGERVSRDEPVPAHFYDGSSAEFVSERTAGVDLARFGATQWTDTAVQRDDGMWHQLGREPGLTEIQMTSGTTTLADPDLMTSPTAFTTHWRACR